MFICTFEEVLKALNTSLKTEKSLVLEIESVA